MKMKSCVTGDRGQEYLTGSGSMAGAETQRNLVTAGDIAAPEMSKVK